MGVSCASVLPEPVARGRPDAPQPGPPLGHVQVDLHQPLLRDGRLQRHGDEGLAELAGQGLLAGQVEVLGQLLADGRAAADHASGLGALAPPRCGAPRSRSRSGRRTRRPRWRSPPAPRRRGSSATGTKAGLAGPTSNEWAGPSSVCDAAGRRGRSSATGGASRAASRIRERSSAASTRQAPGSSSGPARLERARRGCPSGCGASGGSASGRRQGGDGAQEVDCRLPAASRVNGSPLRSPSARRERERRPAAGARRWPCSSASRLALASQASSPSKRRSKGPIGSAPTTVPPTRRPEGRDLDAGAGAARGRGRRRRWPGARGSRRTTRAARDAEPAGRASGSSRSRRAVGGQPAGSSLRSSRRCPGPRPGGGARRRWPTSSRPAARRRSVAWTGPAVTGLPSHARRSRGCPPTRTTGSGDGRDPPPRSRPRRAGANRSISSRRPCRAARGRSSRTPRSRTLAGAARRVRSDGERGRGGPGWPRRAGAADRPAEPGHLERAERTRKSAVDLTSGPSSTRPEARPPGPR